MIIYIYAKVSLYCQIKKATELRYTKDLCIRLKINQREKFIQHPF